MAIHPKEVLAKSGYKQDIKYKSLNQAFFLFMATQWKPKKKIWRLMLPSYRGSFSTCLQNNQLIMKIPFLE